MLRFRGKPGSERSTEWRCCFCLHVRTATILLGIWHLVLHLVALGFLAAIVRDPRLMEELDREMENRPEWTDTLPTPLSNVEPPPNAYTQHVTKDHSLIYHIDNDPNRAPPCDPSLCVLPDCFCPEDGTTMFLQKYHYDVDMGALVTVCTLAITLMLIYGSTRGKPGYLLPFFCMQLFDFAITVLTATGYLCYLRSIHRLVAETRRVPWRGTLLSLPAPALALLVLSAFLAAVLIKAYCIRVVWRCYKYLTMRAHALQTLTPFVISGEGMQGHGMPTVVAPAYPAPDYSSLLPDYEEAVKQTPPPTYRAAVLMHPEASPNTPSEIGEGAAAAAPSSTVVVLPTEHTNQARV